MRADWLQGKQIVLYGCGMEGERFLARHPGLYDQICFCIDRSRQGNFHGKPIKQIELIGSLGAGSLGVSAGAFVNAKLAFLNIFAGTDNLLGTSGSTFIPSTKGAPNFVAGLNVIW